MLVPDPNNANEHPKRSIEEIKNSLTQFGLLAAIVVRKATNVVVAGNGRLLAAIELGWTHIAVTYADFSEVEATAFGLTDNRTAEFSQRNPAIVSRLAALVLAEGFNTGYSAEEIEALRLQAEDDGEDLTVKLAERFLVPPFSVLNAREGWWQDRKRAWIALGIKSELGRGQNLQSLSGEANDDYRYDKDNYGKRLANATPGGSAMPSTSYSKDKARGDGRGRAMGITYNSGKPGDLAAGFNRKAHPIPGGGTGKNSAYMFKTADGDYQSLKKIQSTYSDRDWIARKQAEGDIDSRANMEENLSGTSIFDPVVCELAYRWFCPPKGTVFDPFAGGSVRGIVAAKLGRNYVGIDLRDEQAKANEEQAETICPENKPTWIVGDSLNCWELAGDDRMPGGADFLFSCPPYADLEVYSDDERDLSTMEYDKFLQTYRDIIAMSCGLLKDDRFACFVVGEVRDKSNGIYRNFIGHTVQAFQDAGLGLYNEAILVTAVGSLPIRVGKQFSGYRKLGKTHQQVLVFIKGDPAKAVQACGPVEVTDLAEFLQMESV